MKKTILTLIIAFAGLTLFAQNYYMEMKLTSDQQANGDMKLYSQDGNNRAEISVSIPQLGATMNFVTLTLASNPDMVYNLDEKKKTYTEIKMDADDTWKDAPESDYEVTVLGKETVNGYNTTHVSVKKKGSKSAEEMWTTTELADYADYSKIKSKYTGKDNLYKALKAKGAAGFPVRIKTTEQGQNIQIDLVKAEKKSTPASLFSLSGYTKGNSMSAMPAGIDVQQMMKSMQNMTPEQQKALQQQLEQQYKPK